MHVVDSESRTARDVIVKERKEDKSGVTIPDICVYDETIYTYEIDDENKYVCSYDLEGNQLSKETIEILNEFTTNETIIEFNFINGYYFFESLNHKRLVLQKNDNGWKKRDDLIVINSNVSNNLIDNYNVKDENYKKIILYDHSEGEWSYLNTDTGEKIHLNIDIGDIGEWSYCFTDGKQVVYRNPDNEVYYIEDIFAANR